MGIRERLARLSGRRRQLVVQAAVWVLAVRLGLWLCPFKTLWQLINRVTRRCRAEADPTNFSAGAAAWAVGVACRYVPRATCLTRSLALSGLLAQHGVVGVLRIGVNKTPGGQLQAHAWVEVGGVPLTTGEDLGVYHAFPALGGESR